jgi:hypothetical protein
LNAQQVAQALDLQLGISVNANIANIRIRTIRAWGALPTFNSTAPLQPVTMVVYDLFRAFQQTATVDTSRILEQITSYPDLVSRACVGYRYDKSHSELSVAISSNANAFPIAGFSGMGPNSVVYIDILWRCGTIAPTVAECFDDSSDSEISIIGSSSTAGQWDRGPTDKNLTQERNSSRRSKDELKQRRLVVGNP